MDELKNKLHKIFDMRYEWLNKTTTKIIVIFLIFNIMIITIMIYLFEKKTNTNLNEIEYNENMILSDKKENIQEQNEKIIIYIIGEVNVPGVYELEENSRISDAIESARGITQNADLTRINLAYPLSDGEKIKIPSINEEKDGNNIDENDDMQYTDESLTSNSKDTKININTADISTLTSLPGIGESTAQKIITYREQNGKFKNIEDIKNISGIGESKYSQIKDYIKTK